MFPSLWVRWLQRGAIYWVAKTMDEFILYLSRIHTSTHGSYVLNNEIDKVKPANHNSILVQYLFPYFRNFQGFSNEVILTSPKASRFWYFMTQFLLKKSNTVRKLVFTKSLQIFPNYHWPTYKNSLYFYYNHSFSALR